MAKGVGFSEEGEVSSRFKGGSLIKVWGSLLGSLRSDLFGSGMSLRSDLSGDWSGPPVGEAGRMRGPARSSSPSTLRILMKRLKRKAPSKIPIKIARVLKKGALESLSTSGVGEASGRGVELSVATGDGSRLGDGNGGGL